MNFDRNTALGFILMGVLLVGYIYYNSKTQELAMRQKAHMDSIANAGKPKPDTSVVRNDSLHIDSQNRVLSAGDFRQAVNGTEQITAVENDLVKIAFSNK